MKRALAWVLAPLALGVLAYVTLRAPDLRLHAWLDALGLGGVAARLAAAAAPLRAHVPAPVAGSVPDAAWAFALGAALALVWGRHAGWRAVGAAAVAAVELAQAAHLIEGVFDPIDLVAMLAAYVLAWRAAGARAVQHQLLIDDGGRASAATTAATVARAREISSGPSVTPPTTG